MKVVRHRSSHSLFLLQILAYHNITSALFQDLFQIISLNLLKNYDRKLLCVIYLNCKSYISDSAHIVDCCCNFNIFWSDHLYRCYNAYGIGFFIQVDSLNHNEMVNSEKVYTFELGYSFFMVLGSMFLAQICLLLWSQIIC